MKKEMKRKNNKKKIIWTLKTHTKILIRKKEKRKKEKRKRNEMKWRRKILKFEHSDTYKNISGS